MTYLFECSKCQEVFELVQGVNDPHEYNCDKCGIPAKRVFTTPQVKRNPRFFSDMVGREVSGTTDLDNEIERLNYVNGLSKFTGHNKVTDEWEDERRRKNKSDEAAKHNTVEDYDGYYDSVKTYE